MFKSETVRDPVRCAQQSDVTTDRLSDEIEPTGQGQKRTKAENKTKSQRCQDPRHGLRVKTNLWKT